MLASPPEADLRRALRVLLAAVLVVLVDLALSPASLRAGVAGTRTSEAVMTEPLLPERAPIASYVVYLNQHFGFSADVPSGWVIDDHFTVDSVYGFVVRYTVTGPPDSGSHFGFTELEFSMIPSTRVGGTIPDLATYASVSIEQKNAAGGTVVGDVSTTFLGRPAREIEIQYPQKRPFWDVPSFSPQVTVTVRTKYIVFEKDHHFFEVGIESTDSDWSLYAPAYDAAKSTMAFSP